MIIIRPRSGGGRRTD